MTKEPSKDFREAVSEVFQEAHLMDYDEATTRILAICKEMLVPDASGYEEWGLEVGSPREQGWDACRDEILKQLGEKDER